MSPVELPLISHPEKYTSIPVLIKGFRLRCYLYFAEQEGVSEQHKIAHIISLLTDKAFTSSLSGLKEGSISHLMIKFIECFQQVFDHFPEGNEIGEKLLAIK